MPKIYRKIKKNNLNIPTAEQIDKLNVMFLRKLTKKYEDIITLIKAIVQDITERANKFEKGSSDYYKVIWLHISGYYKNGYSLMDCLYIALYYSVIPDPFYFTFGRYAGRIVQDIIEEDFSYCRWFKDNVIGIDYYTLKAIDYFHKLSEGCIYYDKSIYNNYVDLLEQYIPEEWGIGEIEEETIPLDRYFIVRDGVVSYHNTFNKGAQQDLESFLVSLEAMKEIDLTDLEGLE